MINYLHVYVPIKQVKDRIEVIFTASVMNDWSFVDI